MNNPSLKVVEIKRKKSPYRALSEETADKILKAYFNNKMTTILLMLQRRDPAIDSVTSMKAVIFFDDLFHHMLRQDDQYTYHRVFKWLRLFFKRFPYVKPVQKRKAIAYIKLVYAVMGLEFKLNI